MIVMMSKFELHRVSPTSKALLNMCLGELSEAELHKLALVKPFSEVAVAKSFVARYKILFKI